MTDILPIPDAPAKRFNTQSVARAHVTGVSYMGTDPELNVPVVVKVFRESAFPSGLERQRIVRELQKLATIRHAGLPRVFGSGEENGRLWVAREWIEGETLTEKIAKGRIDQSQAVQWIAQVAAGLGALHRAMLVHRDVRPEHIVIGLDNRARIVDCSGGRFGRNHENKVYFGTPGYAAPEALGGKLVSARSDLYSTGIVLYLLLEGRTPYGTEPADEVIARQQTEPVPPCTQVQDGLLKVLLSLLSKEPRERPIHAEQLEKQLEPYSAARAAQLSDDGPATQAVPEEAIAAALKMTVGPSLIDDDEEAATTVSAESVGQKVPPPPGASVHTGSMRAPAPHVQAQSDIAVAPSTSPYPQSPSALRKATLIGINPLNAAASAPMAPAAAVAAPAGMLYPGATAPMPTEFDDNDTTMVSEDSKIFGNAAPGMVSPHGTALPPLPDDVANRVMKQGGTAPPVTAVLAPEPAPMMGANGARKTTGGYIAPVPTNLPSIPAPPNMDPNGTASRSAPPPGLQPPTPGYSSDFSGPNATLTAPGAGQQQYPGQQPQQQQWQQPPQAAQYPQNVQSPQGYGGQANASAPPANGAAPWAPQGSSAGYMAPPPNAGGDFGGSTPSGVLMNPAYSAGQSQGMNPAAHYPANKVTGAYVAPQAAMSGAYQNQQYNPTGAQAAQSNMSAAWPPVQAKKSPLWPWILAGCVIASLAGGTGYVVAMMQKESPVPETGSNQITAGQPTQGVGISSANGNPTNNGVNTMGIVDAGMMFVPNMAAMVVDAAVMVPVAVQEVDVPVVVAVNVPPQVDPTNGTPENGANNNNVGNTGNSGNSANPTSANGGSTVAGTNTANGSNSANSHTTGTGTTGANNTGGNTVRPPVQDPMALARAAIRRGDNAGARTQLEAYIRTHPRDAEAFYLLGDAIFALGERRPAGTAYRSAIAYGNYARRYWSRLVERQISIGDRAGAINTLNDVLAHHPSDRDAQRKLAELRGGPAPGASPPAFGAPRPWGAR